MTQHSTAFEIERPVPAADALKELPPAPTPASRPAVKKFNFRKLLMAGAAVVVLAGAAWYGFDYWTVGRYLVSTDDAYVKADNTTVAPKVSGYLHEVLVGDNEPVRAGQVLARIDPRDFDVALDQARADVAARSRDRQQTGPARRSTGGDRCRQGDRRRRPGHGHFRRAREQALHRSCGDRLMAACRTRSRRSRASPARRPRSRATPPILPPR